MADHYPAEWWSPRDHYTAEEVRHLERLYPPRPRPLPARPPRSRRQPPPRPRPVLKRIWTCQHCGARFPGYTRRTRRYCSARCTHAARWRRRTTTC